MPVLRLILNILWLVLSGLWLAIGYAAAGLLMFITIIGIPFGIQAFKLAGFALWPFGRVAIALPGRQTSALRVIGNLIWVVLAGWWLALMHLITGIALCITIIGIPFGIANFKLIPVAFIPFGLDIVSVRQAERLEGRVVVGL